MYPDRTCLHPVRFAVASGREGGARVGLVGWGGARAGVGRAEGCCTQDLFVAGSLQMWHLKCALALNHKRLLAEGGETLNFVH